MREKQQRLVITFHTTTQAMQMERVCQEAGIAGRLIPVPREITAGCGMAWSAPPEIKAQMEAFLKEQEICPAGIYTLVI